MLKLLDLFSGIGGFSLGMEATNRIKTIAFVEKDKFCQKVLNKNFKNIPIEEDIRNVKGSNYTADIVSGGFPCQPFSVAGKRKGKDDDRYLWDETIRVVAETKPKWFVGENVEGIINISNGTVLQQIQQDLEKEGFQVQCLVIPASGVGAWHQRKRVWIIGCNVSNTNSIRRSNSSTDNTQNERKEFSEKNVEFSIKSSLSNNVSNSNYSGCKDRTKQHRWEQTQNEKRFDSFSRSNIISNSNSNRNTNEIERSNGEKEKVQREHRQKDSSTWEFIRTNSNDVPNSNARLSFRENKEIQSRGITFAISGKNVPNTNSRMRRRWGTIGQSGANKIWRFCSEKEKQTGYDIWSKAIGCNALLRKENSSETNSKGLQGCSLPTELEREQRQVITKRDTEKQQTWWEIESSLCGVPNGISYELDKGRSNRIKALGNSIVPLIAYEIGKAIISAEDQSD
jgi:DNA (cytosine-5)-methyltransferase 1